jgi:hypothetical protein
VSGETDRKADHRIAKAHRSGVAWRLGIERESDSILASRTDWQSSSTGGTEADKPEAEQENIDLRHGTGNPFGRNR